MPEQSEGDRYRRGWFVKMCDNSDKCCKTVIAAVLSVKRSVQQMCDNVSVFRLLSLKRCASKRRHCADVSVVTVFIHRYAYFSAISTLFLLKNLL